MDASFRLTPDVCGHIVDPDQAEPAKVPGNMLWVD
jgi:hypothetical protein